MIFDEFVELHGDRAIGDDRAIRTGFARLGDFRVMLIGHQKGHNLKERNECLYGCAHPEGYRKALAKMKLAAKFRLPIICLIDTPGRLSRHRRRGARPGPAHRHQPARDVAAADADHLRGHRGRGAPAGPGHRHRRPRQHARARLLLGHQPRGLRRHPVEGSQRRDQAAGRRRPEADRPRPVPAAASSTTSSPSRSAAPTATRAQMGNMLKAYLLRYLRELTQLADRGAAGAALPEVPPHGRVRGRAALRRRRRVGVARAASTCRWHSAKTLGFSHIAIKHNGHYRTLRTAREFNT